MKEQLAKIRAEALAAFEGAKDAAGLDELRVKYLGKKGELTGVLKMMGKLSPEERPAMGQLANDVRAVLEKAASDKGAAYLHEQLRQVDPLSAELIHANNIKRTVRALEYFYLTGEPISSHNKRERDKPSAYHSCYFVLNDIREHIYERIGLRVEKMLEQGLVEEVAALAAAGCTREMVSMQGIGYKEILDYLDGKATLEEAVYILKRDTRHFAKRQLTWFRRERDVIWINKKEFGYDDGQILTYIGEVLHEKGIRCSLDGTRTENKAGR